MTLLREQHYQFIPVCEVCVRGGLHLAIKSQIHVVGWNLEHQSSWFSPFGHRGFVDGGGEKWDVVVNVWRRKWRGRRSELRISWKLPVDLIETSLMIDGLFTKLKLAPAPDHNIHPTVSSPYLWLADRIWCCFFISVIIWVWILCSSTILETLGGFIIFSLAASFIHAIWGSLLFC